MENEKRVVELDRNMDDVFHNLYVLNAAMEAIVQSIPPVMADQVAQRMQQSLVQMGKEDNPPSDFYQGLMKRWRNQLVHYKEAPELRH